MEAPYGEVQAKLVGKMNLRLAELPSTDIRNRPGIRTDVLTGLPAEEMVAYVRHHHADLLVVGVRRHSGLGKIIIGSSTEAILRKAPCAVLAVP